MAAYSAVACFRRTLKQLLDSDQFPLIFPKPQIQSLEENVRSLQSSFDKIRFIPKKWSETVNSLQTRIRDAIYEAEDEIEYSISKGYSEEILLKRIAEDIDLIAKEAESIAEAVGEEPESQKMLRVNPQPAASRFSSKHMIVGQEKDFATVTELLKSEDEQRLVIPITGMPGIGKSTLARSIYESKEAENNFNIRAWVTVSQDYTFQELFSKILNSMEGKNYQAGHYATQGDEQTLFNKVHGELYRLKYLIVVDDVWDTRAWDRIILAFPDKENGSRILATTRIPMVAQYIQRFGYVHAIHPLGLDDSWKLLCSTVFGYSDEASPLEMKKDITDLCPTDLRETGRSIAEKCKGLPLSLMVVGGLLLQERMKLEYWRIIEEHAADAATKGEESYLAILSLSYNYVPGTEIYSPSYNYMPDTEFLSLSYNYLPAKLKGCFLYMGAFPKYSEIRVSKLIKLWVAEGFLTSPQHIEMESSQDSTLELEGRRCLEDLIDRNLISVREKSSDEGIKVCVMHDSLRKLAEKESAKEKFFHSRKKYDQELEGDMRIQRRVSIHTNMLMSLQEVYDSTKSITLARSLLYVGPHHHHPLPFCLTFDLLRVLDAFTVYFIRFPNEFVQLVHLTYLALTYNHELPSKISQLQKLQTLMVRREPKIIFVGASFLPDEIWMMPQLRHIWLTETDFPALPPSPPETVLLLNLQTLSNVNAAFLTDEVLDNMPNLKKLSMWIEAPDKINFNVSKLKQLLHFKFVVLNPVPGKGIEVEAEHFFPITLKRMTLSGCGLPWEYMEYVAENLVDLEVLKLKELAFYGDKWILNFHLKQLKYLLIEYLNFQVWKAGSSFPRLKFLILRHCFELKEIPFDLGFVKSLELIELVDCSPQAVESANDMKQGQEYFDMTDFQVRIFSSWA